MDSIDRRMPVGAETCDELRRATFLLACGIEASCVTCGETEADRLLAFEKRGTLVEWVCVWCLQHPAEAA